MAFKFKDLMINVTSGGGGDTPICTMDTVDPRPVGQAHTCTMDTVEAVGQAHTCTMDTVDPARAMITCTLDTVRGGTGFRLATDGGTGICTLDTVRPATLALMTTVTTVTTLAAAMGTGPTSLAQLKAQLQGALADVERREREQQGGLPQTVEEADDLERRMESALQELREHRKTLGKGEKGAKKEAPKPRKGRK